MKTRCKPGDMAFITSGKNTGKIVHVVRAYIDNELVSGVTWDWDASYPWVIDSAGTPLRNLFANGKEAPPLPSIVLSDCYLKPIRPGNGTDEVLRITDKPKTTQRMQRCQRWLNPRQGVAA